MHFFLCLFTKQTFTAQQLSKCCSAGPGWEESGFSHLRELRVSQDPPSSKPEGAESEVDFSLGLGVKVHGLAQRDGEIGNGGNQVYSCAKLM